MEHSLLLHLQKKAAEVDACEIDGQVLVHFNTATGKCKIAQIDVKTGVGLSLTIDSEYNLEVFNANAIKRVDEMYGDEWYEFENYSLYLMPKSEFTADDDFWEALYHDEVPNNEFLGSTNTIKTNHGLGDAFEEGVYEEDRWVIALSELTTDLEPGTAYAVIAVYGDRSGWDLSKDWAYCFFETPVGISLTASDVSASDIVFDLDIKGPEAYTYYINAIPPTFMGEASFDDFMTMPNEGLWSQLVMYSAQGMGEMFLNQYFMFGMPYEVTAKSVNLKDITLYLTPVQPNTKYHIYVYPYNPQKALEDYNYETDLKPYVFEFTTGQLTVNPDLDAPEMTHELSYEQIITTVTKPSGADMVYYQIYTVDDYTELSNSDELSDDLINYGNVSEENSAIFNSSSTLPVNPGSSYYIVTCALYGDELSQISAEKVDVPAFPIDDDNITVSATGTYNENSASATSVTVSTSASYIAYRVYSTPEWDGFSLNMATRSLKTGDAITCPNLIIVEVKNGTATFTVDASSSKYLLYSAFNWDEEGNKIDAFTTPQSVDMTEWSTPEGE